MPVLVLIPPRARSVEPRPDSDECLDKNTLVFCGPSGCGKSTLISRLMADYPGRFGFSVSHTTRPPRAGELNGVHYHFSDGTKMQMEVDAGLFLEHAIVHGNHYGTSFAAVDSVIQTGKICILDIDVQGVDAVKNSKLIDQSRVVFVMLVPPNIAELEQRLRRRSTDSEEVIRTRVLRGMEEIQWRHKKDYWDEVLENNNVDKCYEELTGVIKKYFKLTGSACLGTLSAKKPMGLLAREAL